MHEHASKMETCIDKETVAICIQASVTCYLHVLYRYTRMVYVPYAYGHTVRVWYTKLYYTRTVYTIRVWYKIRVWYRTSTREGLLSYIVTINLWACTLLMSRQA